MELRKTYTEEVMVVGCSIMAVYITKYQQITNFGWFVLRGSNVLDGNVSLM